MRPSSRPVVYSPQALDDRETVQFAAISGWGAVRAAKYLAMLDHVCGWIGESPTIGPARDEVCRGLRYSPVSQHTIYYAVSADEVRIIRILHVRHDVSALAHI